MNKHNFINGHTGLPDFSSSLDEQGAPTMSEKPTAEYMEQTDILHDYAEKEMTIRAWETDKALFELLETYAITKSKNPFIIQKELKRGGFEVVNETSLNKVTIKLCRVIDQRTITFNSSINTHEAN